MPHLVQTQFTMVRGDHREYDLLVTDASGTPVDLTGVTMKWEAVRKGGEDPAFISKSLGAGIVADPDQVANTGKAVLTIDPADTSGLGNWDQTLRWDLEVTVSGKKQTVAQGTLRVEQEVTQ